MASTGQPKFAKVTAVDLQRHYLFIQHTLVCRIYVLPGFVLSNPSSYITAVLDMYPLYCGSDTSMTKASTCTLL